MADYASIQERIDHGRGVGANHIGQPYSVYRISSTSSGDVISASNLIQENFNAYRREFEDEDGSLETSFKISTYWYELMADASTLLVGDILIQTDNVYGAGSTLVNYATDQFDGVCMVNHAPLKKIIGARLDRNATFYRPATVPLPSGDMDSTLNSASPLVLSNGTFSFGTAGQTASKIPVGFMPDMKETGRIFTQTPNMIGNTNWICYVIPLPGVVLREGDRMVTDRGSRYVVVNPYRQEAGVVGSQFVVRREVGV